VNIALDRDKPIPLARQIQAHLERLIRERLLTPGMKLPATRELARTLTGAGYRNPRITDDLAGRERVVEAQWQR